jgi:hypothetical protein|tara:strand:+ start:1183 stop:1431 length:249 start_codon:yes stop_codon:yes gene_type:complete
LLKKIQEILSFKLILYLAIALAVIGTVIVLANLLLIKGFPLELIGIEIDAIDELPISYFLISLLFWYTPLLLALLARFFLKK